MIIEGNRFAGNSNPIISIISTKIYQANPEFSSIHIFFWLKKWHKILCCCFQAANSFSVALCITFSCAHNKNDSSWTSSIFGLSIGHFNEILMYCCGFVLWFSIFSVHSVNFAHTCTYTWRNSLLSHDRIKAAQQDRTSLCKNNIFVQKIN